MELPGESASILRIAELTPEHGGNYVVVVENSAGRTSSHPATVTVKPFEPPPDVRNPAATRTAAGVELTWNWPASEKVDAVEIVRSIPASSGGPDSETVFSPDDVGFESSFTDSTASPDVDYVYRIRAVNGAGRGSIGQALPVSGKTPSQEQLTKDLVVGSGATSTGLNFLGYPFIPSPQLTAESFGLALGGVDTVSRWDPARQRFLGHPVGTTLFDFGMQAGIPVFVNVSTPRTVTFEGPAAEVVTFELITTDKTNLNVVTVPLHRRDLNSAEAVGSSIPGCDTVSRWDASRQRYLGHPVGTVLFDFSVEPGDPLFVNVSSPITLTW